jgi:hypothetical protein
MFQALGGLYGLRPDGQDEGRPSFLKKRSKKLLQMASGIRLNAEAPVPAETSKSFLVLFFKKELLFLAFPLKCFLCALAVVTRQASVPIEVSDGCGTPQSGPILFARGIPPLVRKPAARPI